MVDSADVNRSFGSGGRRSCTRGIAIAIDPIGVTIVRAASLP